MKGFKLVSPQGTCIHFEYYLQEAPHTCAAFHALLPLSRSFLHARVSGQEIWFSDMPPLHCIQENASVFTTAGEVVLGPATPARTQTANCFGIYYGQGKGLDAANIFACVIPQDAALLQALGNEIWQGGAQTLQLQAW